MSLPVARTEPGPEPGGLAEAETTARRLIETALEQVSPLQREQFWNAIGLYYSTRRHPGASDGAVGDAPKA